METCRKNSKCWCKNFKSVMIFLGGFILEKPAAATRKQPHKRGRAHGQPRKQPRTGPSSEESASCPAHHYLRWPHYPPRLPGKSAPLMHLPPPCLSIYVQIQVFCISNQVLLTLPADGRFLWNLNVLDFLLCKRGHGFS